MHRSILAHASALTASAALLAVGPVSAAVVGVQAENGIFSGSAGFNVISPDGALGGFAITTAGGNNASNGTAGDDIDAFADYSVTFPTAGTYDVYVRYQAPGGNTDDSFFAGATTGNSTTVASFDLANGLPSVPRDANGFIVANLSGPGSSRLQSYTIAADALTQDIAIGGREDGFVIDAFVFATQDETLDAAAFEAVFAPVPEPASAALFGVGVVALGARRRTGRRGV